MSTFAFLPRSVKRRKFDAGSAPPTSESAKAPSQVTVSPQPPSTPTSAGAQVASESSLSRGGGPKGKQKQVGEIVEDGDTRKSPTKRVSSTLSSLKTVDLEELAALVCLALSDYALWADPDLRREIDLGVENSGHDFGGEGDGDGDGEPVNSDDIRSDDDGLGYVSLAYLLRRSPVFSLMSGSPSFFDQPETAFVKALRAHAADYIDVRLIVNPEVYSRTLQWSKAASALAGYEVRRKIFPKTEHSGLSGHGKAYWDNLTIYVENIPILYRSVSGILKFITAILNISNALPLHPTPRIQNVAFLPHHQDKPGSIPVCKGFALVTLSNREDANTLLEQWPWDVSPRKPPVEASTSAGNALESQQNANFQLRRDAQKFGFRCLSKTKWEELRAEYLLYRQQLVDEMNRHQDQELEMRTRSRKVGGSSQGPGGDGANLPALASSSQNVAEEVGKRPMDEPLQNRGAEGLKPIHPGSGYPSGCLVFVRNLHPETNKTTLRTLFSRAWNEGQQQHSGEQGAAGGGFGLDYLDYSKGMDRCHIRLSTPSHAQHLVSYFSTHSIRQSSGLDGAGSTSSASPVISASDPAACAIAPELVLGKREELYWEKVPEKVRRQAVEKALKILSTSGGPGEGVTVPLGDGGGKKRKRRK